MADDPKAQSQAGTPANSGPPPAGEAPPSQPGKAPPPNVGNISADALSDGTKPTILTPGESHRPVIKGKSSLTAIYHKADIMTTLLTLAGAVVAGIIILGLYLFLTHRSVKPTAPPGKATTLSQSDLSKLGSFFNGNSAGGTNEVLTITSSSLFQNRVAVNSDLKVTGGLEVDGPTALGNLTVDQTSTLGVTNVRGQLTVNGPSNLQGPTTLSDGGTVKGDWTVSGNGSFGGSVSAGVLNVGTLSVSGALNINGHLQIGGPSNSASGVSGISTNASVAGNDAAGTVTITALPTAGNNGGIQLVTVNFHAVYSAIPVVVITPVGPASAAIEPYVSPSASGFTVGAANLPASSADKNYTFNYWVVQY